ncbi:MAG TPA: hypothetical protein VG818_11535 [Gemmatimonadaceae bacterium]|jgi:hypothetical protein|nr:hypothetical protein [Gemmatimonadaceae bacterium]
MTALKNREGFALPMAILVIAVITAALAAGFLATNSEIATNQAERGVNRAFWIAQNGLEQFLVRRSESGFCQLCYLTGANAPPVAQYESARVAVTGGYADVTSRQVHASTGSNDPAIYFVMSHGVDTTVKMSGAGNSAKAERTVGMYAKWNTMVMNVLAGWTSLSGISKQGSSGTISGVDQCGQDTSRAGVSVPKGEWSSSGHFSPTGNPPLDTTKSVSQLAAQTKIDWASIMNGAITPDVEIPPNSFPSSSKFADTSYWPIIRIHSNNYSLPNAGQGIIIADSNFTISGSNMWNGIILVGGSLTSNGNNTTSGATISGLNILRGGTADTSVVISEATANGTKSYVYNSCNVSRATKGMQVYQAVPNTWIDNVAIY